ncbi:FHA domain-containing protein [Zhongshania sp.]|uniref:FHA domain-containing protein n=1 Tax=Zhongshania sp. TaxID=1971902 RepID=UPI00356222E3
MAKLVLSFQGRVIEDFPLDKERVTIGRAADNDICIENLAVSGRHAAIETFQNDSFLVDLGSTNGTLVNGNLVTRHALRSGDHITIGKHSLTYHGVQRAAEVDDEVEKTIAIRPGMRNSEPAPEPMMGYLKVQNGGAAGREMMLSKALTKLGKAGFQVAAISRRQQDYYLEHIEGQDGRTPIINGEQIGLQPRKLANGDTLEIANTRLGFELRPA